MRKNGPLLLPLLFFLAFACSPCSGLQQRDRALEASFDAVKAQYLAGGLPREAYVHELRKLREKEEALFEAVRGCQFKDQQQYNYWYRSRMKFPSRIQTELDNMEKL